MENLAIEEDLNAVAIVDQVGNAMPTMTTDVIGEIGLPVGWKAIYTKPDEGVAKVSFSYKRNRWIAVILIACDKSISQYDLDKIAEREKEVFGWNEIMITNTYSKLSELFYAFIIPRGMDYINSYYNIKSVWVKVAKNSD